MKWIVALLVVVGIGGSVLLYLAKNYENLPIGHMASYESVYAPPQALLHQGSIEQIAALVTYLYDTIEPHVGGLPPSSSSGLEILAGLQTGQLSLQHDSLSHAYVALANGMGIPSRLVEARSTRGHHCFAESYVRETASWVYVDPTVRKAGVLDSTGRPLNATELFRAVCTDATDELVAVVYEGGQICHCPLRGRDAVEKQYFVPSATLVYPLPQLLFGSTFNKLKTYATAPPSMLSPISDSLIPYRPIAFTTLLGTPLAAGCLLITALRRMR